MHPVLFQFHGVTIYSYGFCVAVAVLVSLILAEKRAAGWGLRKTDAADILFAGFIFGIAGARLLFVWQYRQDYAAEPWRVFYIQEGGLVWYGGFLGVLLAGSFYVRWKRLPVLKICDFFSPVTALAHGIGRIGCFLNNCCYGRRTGSFLGVRFPGESYAMIPVQLYEAAGLFVISGLLFFYSRKPRREGRVFLWYLLLYSVLRFLIEFLRGDNAHNIYLTLPQWMSAGFFIAASTFLIFGRNNK